jgi:uncharacterized protein YcfJ
MAFNETPYERTIMTQREIAKKIAEIAISTAVGCVITRTLTSSVSATQKFKTAEMAGTFGGWYVGARIQPHVEKVIDDFFDRREAKKN